MSEEEKDPDVHENHYFECACWSNEHMLVFTYDYCGEDDFRQNEIIVSTFLANDRNFFGRVRDAIKYVFGYKCKYGHFECTIINEFEVLRLKELCDKVINQSKKDNIPIDKKEV